MKRINFIGVTMLNLAFIAVIGGSCLAQESFSKVIKRVKPAIVSIINYSTNRVMPKTGTAFLVDHDKLITARHCLTGAEWADIKTIDGAFYRVKGVLADDEKYDLAVVQLEAPVPNMEPLTIAKQMPDEGERVFLIGSPLGLEGTISDGIISAVRDVPGLGRLFQLTAPASPGNSGCPVFNMNGEVVGVETSNLTVSTDKGISVGENLNFAIPGERAEALKISVGRQIKPLAEWAKSTDDKWAALSTTNIDLISLRPISTGNFTASLPFFEAGAKRNPQDALAWYSLAFCEHYINDYDKAIEHYKKAISLKPDFAMAYANLGIAYAGQNNNKAAIDNMLKAIDLGYKDCGTYWRLGSAYLAGKDVNAAIKYCRLAVDADPRNSDAHYYLGEAFLENKENQEAFQEFILANKINPNNSLIPAKAAIAANNIGRFIDAENALKQAELGGLHELWMQNEYGRAYIGMGDSAAQQNEKSQDYEQAISSLEKATQSNSNYSDAFINLGEAYMRAEKYDKAIDALEKGILQKEAVDKSTLAKAYFYLGIAYSDQIKIEPDTNKRKDLTERAVKDYKTAIKLNPNNVLSYYNLASLYVSLYPLDKTVEKNIVEQYKMLKALSGEWAEKLKNILPIEIQQKVELGNLPGFTNEAANPNK